MTIGVIGRKLGMTRVFNDAGESLPVTVIQVESSRIVVKKSVESDGYAAIQVTTGEKKLSRVNKSEAGHFAKAGVTAGRILKEFRLDGDEGKDLNVGDEILADIFKEGQKVDVTGVSIGKGFAGVIKKYNFSMQDATHGNSLAHRAPGSIGQNQTPGRVIKGKKMTGHMGNVQRTMQNLTVVSVDLGLQVVLVRGAVPGSKGGTVYINPAVKSKT